MDNDTAKLNNLGVAFLQQGHIQMALHCFHNALSRVSQLCMPGQSRISRQNQTCPMENLYSQISLKGEDISHRSLTSNTFVYSHGIAIKDEAISCLPDGFACISIVSSIILFNLGLVYHLKGVEERAVGSTKLKKAESLYSKSSELLVDAGEISCFSTGNPFLDILPMALLNNMAHINFELCQYKESRSFFDELVVFCNATTQVTYTDLDAAVHLSNCRSNFLLNALILRRPTMASAA